MKQLIALCLAALCIVSSHAQQTSPNLIGSQNISGVTGITAVNGYSGGTTPGYISNSNTIAFGWMQGTAAYTYAVSQALQSSGITFLGYNYSWDYLNQDYSRGTLSANVNFAAINGTSLHSKSWTLGPTTDWTTVSGTETFTAGIPTANLSNFSLSFTGRDNRGWAGYYGPQVRNASLSVNYTFDQCSSNPLSSPTCLGYAQAYHDQQCTANPLYASDCPGYAAAYQTQQCSINPLYSPQCPGYATAYQTQQCNINPLYSAQCPGYEQAHHDQQCTANPLYATDCVGYQQAYFNQQCTANGLYSTQCPNYSTAYATKQALSATTSATATTTNTATVNTISSETAALPTSLQSPAQQAVSTPSTTSPTSVTSVTSVISAPSTTSPTGVTSLSNASNTQSTSSSSSEKSSDKPASGSPTGQTQTASTSRPQAKEPDQKQAQSRAKVASENMKNATRMEDQVAVQGAVVNAMAFVPGFSAYQNSIVPDYNQLQMARQYGKPPIDNNRTQRLLGGAQEQRWREIVDSQYK